MSLEGGVMILTWVTILLLGLAMSGLLRQVRLLSVQPSLSDRLTLPLLGRQVSVSDFGLKPGQPSLLLFLSAECDVCRLRLAELESALSERDHRNGSEVIALYRGDAAQKPSQRIRQFGGQDPLFSRLHIPLTPFAAIVGDNGSVVHAQPLGSQAAVRDMVSLLEGYA
jgi:hypothetical protein